jgi:predicted peroxiredoxin
MKLVGTTGVLGMLLFTFASCNEQPAPVIETTSDDLPAELIINLISDPMADPHSSLMGLHLAQKARKNGMEVTVFLNVHGVKLMSPGADTLVFHGENLHQVLKDLMADGGAVRACPHCMMVHTVEEGQLLNGVQVMQDGQMMGKIKSNPTVFTY